MQNKGEVEMTESKKKNLAVIGYCLCLFAVWTVFELFIKDHIGSQLIKEVIKTAVWVFPAMFFIHKFHDTVQIGLNEMFVTKVKWWRYLWVYALLAVWVLLGGFRPGGLSFTLDLDALIIVLFVGITEEMVFRGWLLNATVKDMPKWLAILINAVLFLLIHFPRLIQEGILISTFTSFNFIGLVALSVIFSVSFLKSKNILIPITLHMFYDLMAFVFLS